MSHSIEQAFQARLKRFNDAVSLSKPDRVPVVSLAGFFVTNYAGLTPKQALYDYEKILEMSALRQGNCSLCDDFYQ